MGKLADFLKSKADTIRSEKQRRRQELDEWGVLLADLYSRIDAWLAAIDPDGLLDVTKDTVVLNDAALGPYKAPMRRVEVGYNSVDIVPRGRRSAATIRLPGADKSIRAHGAVEIRGPVRSCFLYQLPDGNWFIQTDRTERGSDSPVEPVTADNFETALASFLQ